MFKPKTAPATSSRSNGARGSSSRTRPKPQRETPPLKTAPPTGQGWAWGDLLAAVASLVLWWLVNRERGGRERAHARQRYRAYRARETRLLDGMRRMERARASGYETAEHYARLARWILEHGAKAAALRVPREAVGAVLAAAVGVRGGRALAADEDDAADAADAENERASRAAGYTSDGRTPRDGAALVAVLLWVEPDAPERTEGGDDM